MSVIKFKGEYKVTMSFDFERNERTPSNAEMQETAITFPDCILHVLQEKVGEEAVFTVEELSSFFEEA